MQDKLLEYIDTIFGYEIASCDSIIELHEEGNKEVPESVLADRDKADLVKEYIHQKLIMNPNKELRLGQKLCNWILKKGISNEDVHSKLFNMDDKDFVAALNEDVDYAVPHTVQGMEIANERAQKILGLIEDND